MYICYCRVSSFRRPAAEWWLRREVMMVNRYWGHDAPEYRVPVQLRVNYAAASATLEGVKI